MGRVSSDPPSGSTRPGGPTADEPYPLSPLQQGMLFHWRLDPNSGTDLEQAVVQLDEVIEPPRMAQAWKAVVDSIPILRTRFEWEGLSAPRQRVVARATPEFTVEDLRSVSATAGESRIAEYLRADRFRGFDLTRAPAMRVALFQMKDARFTLVWTFHHILIDGRTFEDILRRAFSFYEGEPGESAAGPTFRDYVEWVGSRETAAAVGFWTGRLRGYTTPVAIPSDRGPTADRYRPGHKDLALSVESTARLRDLADREGLSLNVVLMGAWALLLSRYSGQPDVVFGAAKTTRRGTVDDADAIVGLLLATVPVRVVVQPDLTVADWLKGIRADWVSLRGFEHLPLVEIRQASEIHGSAPLFESVVVYETHRFGTRLKERGGAWSRRSFAIHEQTGQPLTLLGYGEQAMTLKILFDANRFEVATIDRIAAQLVAVLEAWGTDSRRPLSHTPTLTAGTLPPAERRLLLDTWQQTTRAYDDSVCVHEQFERQVERTPDAAAVVFGDDTLTYRELNARANCLARLLRSAGVCAEVPVGIAVERSLDMAVGLLGIMKAGGAYVPMDPAYPRDRLSMMAEDAKLRIVVTQRHLRRRIPMGAARAICLDELPADAADSAKVALGATSRNLAYVIFTSGSTGRPKGTMVEHRNVANFFVGMDDVVGTTPGVWLALTSISFDISVLELFWALSRGFKVVIAPETDQASLEQRAKFGQASTKRMGFGLFYFAADSGRVAAGDAYRLLIDGAKFADANGFDAVWTPERHFHAFGGLYPNPSVTTAALSTITSRVALRAGSIVLPLHNPIRIAEDWAVIDQLSGGRVGLSFASGWHANDFAVMPENYARRHEIMVEHIETVLKLWRGEKVSVKNGNGESIEVSVLPRAVQRRPPIWIASAGSPETFILAGRLGANVLTNMLGQDLAGLKTNFAAYRAARREHDHKGDGIISVMLHTFVTDSTAAARELARKPFSDYLASSFDLVKIAPKMFPAFKQPSRGSIPDTEIDHTTYTPNDMAALLDHAFDRYFDTAGLFGTPERALEMVDRLAEIGANEIACLIDFGIEPNVVLESLPHLKRLQDLYRERAIGATHVDAPVERIGALIERHRVTHVQCTPSVARMLASDPPSLAALAQLDVLLLGGESLPTDLADRLTATVRGRVLNMYGPTETTVWSTTSSVAAGGPVTIGRPIANTTIRILDDQMQLVPIGSSGELYIGGHGVARGYFALPELTADRFIVDPFDATNRLYRTGDLARYRADGDIEFLGRLDHQVKVRGHRIELGEIETTLNRHSAVRQGVVVPRQLDEASSPSLVAYVVLDSSPNSSESDAERVRHWQRIWDDTYRAGDSDADPRFRIAGWNDSCTGEPIPAPEMREWLEATVQRITALRPRRIVEIGCGTGMILYGVLPHVERYTGVDISAAALESIQSELTPAEAAKVTLLLQPAHAVEGIPDRSCDVVVVNSVAQYFPDVDYLVGVIRRATDLVADGGYIFVGDVRSLAHLTAFHTSIELEQAPAQLRGAELGIGIDRRVAHESELLLAEQFFHVLARDLPRLSGVEVELKRGESRNELTAYRYDVVLSVGPKPSRAAAVTASGGTHVETLADVRALLETRPVVIRVTDVPNARLTGIMAARRALQTDPGANAATLRSIANSHASEGVDPEALYALDASYKAHVRWARSGDPSRFDAMLTRNEAGVPVRWDDPPVHDLGPVTSYANTPVKAMADESLTTQLRAHLRATLPEYMIPATIIVMDAFPLTPNGTIDRKALPMHDRPRRAAADYVAPTNELEAKIADIWKELLAIERVGRRDNIFDLGANSLLTMQANSRLSSMLGRAVSLVTMFRFPTVESLAAHLNGDSAAAGDDKRSKERASRADQAAERRRALRAEKKR